MTVSDALAWLQSHSYGRFGIVIRNTSARAYLRDKWSVRVRAKGCESLEAMIVRLALKAQMQEQFTMPPAPKPKPSRKSKAHLKRVRSETLAVN